MHQNIVLNIQALKMAGEGLTPCSGFWDTFCPFCTLLIKGSRLRPCSNMRSVPLPDNQGANYRLARLGAYLICERPELMMSSAALCRLPARNSDCRFQVHWEGQQKPQPHQNERRRADARYTDKGGYREPPELAEGENKGRSGTGRKPRSTKRETANDDRVFTRALQVLKVCKGIEYSERGWQSTPQVRWTMQKAEWKETLVPAEGRKP